MMRQLVHRLSDELLGLKAEHRRLDAEIDGWLENASTTRGTWMKGCSA